MVVSFLPLSFLPSLAPCLPPFTKDLFHAHTWAGSCFEGGQRRGPVIRELTTLLGDNNYPAWNIQEIIRGNGECRCKNVPPTTLRPLLAALAFLLGNGPSTWVASCCVEGIFSTDLGL